MTDALIKVLLVDDDEDDYVVTRDMLAETKGRFDLDWLTQFDSAVDAMCRNEHDVYLLDYHLGEHNGLDLLREANSGGCIGPVILLTGQAGQDVDREATEAGFADFLEKGQINSVLLERSIRYSIMHARTLDALRESEAHFRATFDQAAVGIAHNATDGTWLQVNQRLCDIVGYSAEELLELNFQDITHPDDIEFSNTAMQSFLAGEIDAHTCEKRYLHKDGSVIWVNRTVSLVRGNLQKPKHFVAIIEDITERKRMEAQLLHDALHDSLTGLPNQTLFMDRLEHVVEQTKRNEDYLFAVLFVDLDRFKLINDSIGHIIGDQLLTELARRLEQCVRPGDTVARFGGDEFTILLDDLKDASESLQVAERIRKDLTLPFNLSGHEIFTNASIGIALSNIGYQCAEDVLRDSDIAMYRAKACGKARHEVFNPDMHICAVDHWKLDGDLRRAIERDEFLVFYQPIVSLVSGKITGVEALARWQHPQRGLLLPEEFIPFAEETGTINIISEWLLRKACAQSRIWHDDGYPLRLAVNFSGKQFQSQNLAVLIMSVLEETGLASQFFDMEITESVAMQNIDSGIPILSELSNMDISISIDDFGTGHSSLGYLKRFPINTLKIDQSFIRGMTSESKDTAIPKAIIAMAHGLKLRVVAEGVETQEQLAFLHEHACDSMQGYFFSHPLPECELTTLLHTDRVLPPYYKNDLRYASNR
jgi:diguanylate cyclase (GGDEF)-like protein/PAS domain S-box-containing protein